MAPCKILKEADCATTTHSHFALKIKSFSLFSKNNVEKYESGEFEVGGHKWKLIFYPNGDKSRNGEGHVSVYLAASETSSFQLGGEFHAAIRLSVYDQIRDRFFTEGKVTRFHALNTEWGVPRYMPLKTFTNPSNGYLKDDTCVLGVEVFAIKSLEVGECLTLEKSSTTYTHEWKISKLSSLYNESFSDEFTVGDHKWRVSLFPRGNGNSGQSLSMYLVLVDEKKLASPQRVNTRFTCKLKSRNHVVHCEQQASVWLSSSQDNQGWRDYMPMKRVRECLPDDDCVIEAEVTVLATVTKLP